jgi:hypothetical protein
MYAALAVAGIAYYLFQNRGLLSGYLTPSKPAPTVISFDEDDEQAWAQGWVTTLMRLQSELVEHDRECCVPLVRELIWRFMGGEPNDVPARESSKK